MSFLPDQALIEFLHYLRELGVNHVIFALKYGTRPPAEALDERVREVVPHFPAHTGAAVAAR